jgi:hypothetical protein
MEGEAMTWDVGIMGVVLLFVMSITFGALAQLLWGRGATTSSLWLVGADAFFVFGLLISEGWFGWATEEDLQPNYDGLSFDETLLAVLPAAITVLLARRWIRNAHSSHGMHPTA